MTAHAVVLLVLACPAAAATREQAEQPASDVASLERIRRGLAADRPPTISTCGEDAHGRSILRVRVDFRPEHFRLAWDPAVDTAVPAYVRPWVPGPHFEFLRMVTPEEFRASAVYSGGVDVLGLLRILARRTDEHRRRQEEEKVRRQIRQELAALKKEQGVP